MGILKEAIAETRGRVNIFPNAKTFTRRHSPHTNNNNREEEEEPEQQQHLFYDCVVLMYINIIIFDIMVVLL